MSGADADATRPAGEPPARRAPLAWRILLHAIGRLPQGAISRLIGRLADVTVPRVLRKPIYGAFASLTGLDAAEAERPFADYTSFDSFFVRRLRPGLRKWPDDGLAIASPVDGTIGQSGTISEGNLVQAKGRLYETAALLDDREEASRFDGGAFLTLYLSPRDYHRIHSPVAGEVPKARHVPGALLPVNEPAVRTIDNLFPRNERVVCYLDGPAGRCAVVAVGAFNVGRIEVVFDDSWRSNRRGAAARDIVYEPGRPLSRGDELMVFHLGSTVVLLFEPGRITLDAALQPGRAVRLGQRIGSLVDGSTSP